MTMSTIRRRAGIVAAVAAAGFVLGGCAGDGGGDDDPGVLTIFMPQAPNMDLETNEFTLELEERFDVDLRFETTTMDANAAAESRQISIASGDYPDAYMLIPYIDTFSQAELQRLGQQGVIVPIGDLIQESAPTIAEAFEETPEFESLATAPDGSVWGLPQWNDCFHCSFPYKLWMNSTWLDTLGLEQPTTPEELREVLRAFRDGDPNGNGIADEIALTSRGGGDLLPYLMNAFVTMAPADPTGSAPVSLGLDGDEVVLQPTRDEWREGLAFVQSLWAEGLIDEASFTQNADALRAKGDNAGTVIVGSFMGTHPGFAVTLGQEDGRDRQYDAVAPLEGGTAAYSLPSDPGASFVITSAATDEEQQVLIEIMDYIVGTDGHLLAQFGPEDETWVAPAEGAEALDPSVPALYQRLPVDAGDPAIANASWGPRAQYYSSAEFRGGEVVNTDIYAVDGLERRLFEATELYAPYESDDVFPFWNVWVDQAEAADLATTQTNVESLVAQANAEFVTGVRDISDDAAWASFQEELEAIGADAYVSAYQDAYDASE